MRVDKWRRDPGAPFDDLAREEYAKARAKGGSIKASAQMAGVEPATGTEFEKHPEMRARIRELRSGAETFVGVSVGYILQELRRNVDIARENNQLKSSNEALKMMYDIISKDASVMHDAARALPPDTDPRKLKAKLLATLKLPAAPPPAEVVEHQPEEDDDAAE